MKIIKNAIGLFSFLLLLSASNYANASSTPQDWKAEIAELLAEVDVENISNLPEKVLVDFMLTETGEIVVLSTSFNNLDSTIKSKLNYKRLAVPELKPLEKYTLPIVFKKQ